MHGMKKQHGILGFLRILMGWIFLWPFLDKIFGFGFATESGKAWIDGVSPTVGFLKFSTRGPFAGVFQWLAGNPFVDWLFMVGLLLIGLALILGIGVRIAAVSGALMLFLMWLAVLPPDHNPFVSDHIIYIVVLALLFAVDAGQYVGFGKWWQKTALAKKYRLLR